MEIGGDRGCFQFTEEEAYYLNREISGVIRSILRC